MALTASFTAAQVTTAVPEDLLVAGDQRTLHTILDSIIADFAIVVADAEKGAANGVAPLNATSKIDSTYLDFAALGDIHVAADDADRFALSNSAETTLPSTRVEGPANNGDIIAQIDTQTLYVVIDDTQLNVAAGYLQMSATTVNAADVVNVPAGGIASTTIQNAINELDTEKVGTARLINTTAPIQGGGDLTADRTLTFDISAAAAATPVVADLIVFRDADDGLNKQASISDVLALTSTNYTVGSTAALRPDAAGSVTVAHGETGYTPTFASAYTPADNVEAKVTAVDATNITLQLYSRDGSLITDTNLDGANAAKTFGITWEISA